MKKPPVVFTLSLLGVLTAAASCSLPLDTPNKIRIKTDTDIALTVPKTGEENIVHYFDDIIKDNMAGQEGMEIFDYAPPNPEWGEAKAYLIRYKVDAIEFTLDPVEIENPEIDPIVLAEIEVPKNIGGGVDVDFTGGLQVSGNSSAQISSYNSDYFISSDDMVRSAVIEEGTLEITPVSGLTFSGLNISLDGINDLVSQGNGIYTLDGETITDSTAITISGDITNTTGSPINLNQITLTPKITKFAKVQIQTNEDHSGDDEKPIDLSGIPDGVNFVTFEEIGVKLKFTVKRGGIEDTGVTVAGLPVKIKAPLLDLDENKTVDEDSFQDGLFFTNDYHTLYKNSADFGNFPDYPGVQIEGTDNKITVTVNPKIDDKYAIITLKNLSPGELAVSVQPAVTLDLASVNVNLKDFVKEPLNGRFPDEGLNMADVFDGMGTMGENINFNQLDLYLYMGGEDKEFLNGTKFKLTAETGGDGLDTLLTEGPNGYEAFVNLEPENEPPDFDSIDTMYSENLGNAQTHNAQFYTRKLVDVINKKPSDLKIAYDIEGKHLQIDGDDLEEKQTIVIQPELIMVMPLWLRLLAGENEDYGSMKLTDPEPVADPKPEDDIFGREGPGDEINDYLKQLKRISLRVDYDNFMGLDDASVYILSKDYEGKTNWEKSLTLYEGAGKTLLMELGPDDITVYPFRPGLEIRVPRETGKDYGLIEMKRSGEDSGGIWAKISIEAEAHVDMVVDL
jgi:hypothetical protein